MEVRPAEPDDADEIRRVAKAAWHAAYDDVLGSDTVEERTDEWYDPARLRGYFDRETFAPFVAVDDGRLVGYALSSASDDGDGVVWRLGALYVHPDRWREGIGSALLDRVERTAAENRADALQLVVLAANDTGRSFYEARGYEQRGERDAALDEDVTEYVYEKRL